MDGKRAKKTGSGREMPQYRSFEVEKSGLNVELSIDRFVQAMVGRELESVVEEFNPLSASVVVGDPKSGSILALANMCPTLTQISSMSTRFQLKGIELFPIYMNFGSTFKIVPVCAALNEGLVQEHDIIDCSVATYQLGTW